MTDPYAALRQCVEALELHNEYPGSIWPFQVKATRNAAITAARAALERQQLSYEREREIDQDEIERLLALRRDDARALERMRALIAEAEVIATYGRDDGLRDWVDAGAWLYPGERVVVLREECDDD